MFFKSFQHLLKTIVYIMGVSGSGKTTIGKLVSEKTGIPFFDADDFHSTQNKEKMKAGIPLTDADRLPWLKSIHQKALEQSKIKGAIIACSALKEKYRLILNAGIDSFEWIFLEGDILLIKERMSKRKNHFMPVQLLKSQFESLQIPENAFRVNIKNNPDVIVAKIIRHLKSL